MDIQKLLSSYIDDKYKIFQEKIVPTNNIILGIKIPTMRKIAKNLLKEYSYEDILVNLDLNIFEHVLLKGFIIANINTTTKKRIILIKDFLYEIDNWCVCDTFVSELKLIKDNLFVFYELIHELLNQKETFVKRFAIVSLLTYYLNNDYIDEVLNILLEINSDDYYVMMAISWCYSYCFMKYFDKTFIHFQNNKSMFSKEIIRMTKQKCYDSYQIDNDKKLLIKNL